MLPFQDCGGGWAIRILFPGNARADSGLGDASGCPLPVAVKIRRFSEYNTMLL